MSSTCGHPECFSDDCLGDSRLPPDPTVYVLLRRGGELCGVYQTLQRAKDELCGVWTQHSLHRWVGHYSDRHVHPEYFIHRKRCEK